jgi:hypothetical protein
VSLRGPFFLDFLLEARELSDVSLDEPGVEQVATQRCVWFKPLSPVSQKLGWLRSGAGSTLFRLALGDFVVEDWNGDRVE